MWKIGFVVGSPSDDYMDIHPTAFAVEGRAEDLKKDLGCERRSARY